MAQRVGPSGENVLPPSSTPKAGVKAESWERIHLGSGIELHVRQPLSQEEQRFVNDLLEYAQRLRQTRI
jgi:hypothetical protein